MEMKLPEAWSPLANTISAFRGSLEWSAQGNLEYLTGASGERTWKKIKGRAILHTDKSEIQYEE